MKPRAEASTSNASPDRRNSVPGAERRQADTVLLGIAALTATLMVLVSGRSAPFGVAIVVLALVVRAFVERTPLADWWRPDLAAWAVVALLGYALLSILWAVERLETLTQVGLALALLTGVQFARAFLGLQSRQRLAIMSFFVVLGMLIGTLYLATETLTAQALKRAFYNTFTWIKPTNAKYYNYVQGQVVYISDNDLNRSLTVLVLLIWPAMAMMRSLWQSRARTLLPIVLFGITGAAVLPSLHDSSKLAMAAGLTVLAVGRYDMQIARRLMIIGWTAAVLLVVPLSALALHQKLYTVEWLPDSHRDRVVIWGHTANEYMSAPILGIGARSTKSGSEESARTGERLPDYVRPLRTGRHAHNVYLQVWYELGAIGAALFLAVGLAVIGALSRLPAAVAPFGLAMWASGMGVILPSWGVWQGWFMASFALSAIMMALAACLAARTAAAVESGEPLPPLSADLGSNPVRN